MIGLSVNFSQSLPCIIYQYIIYLSSIKTSRGPVGTLIPFVRPFVCAFVRLSVCLMASLMVAMPMPMPMMMMKLSGGHCRSLPLTMNIPPLWMLIGTNTRLPVDHHTWFSPAIVASSKIRLPWLSGHTVLKLTPPDKRVQMIPDIPMSKLQKYRGRWRIFGQIYDASSSLFRQRSTSLSPPL